MKIGIIKLGAKGDVLRTLPLLIAIKKKYKTSEITWITRRECEEIIKTSPYVTNILKIPLNSPLPEFDILYNFDIEAEASNLAVEINAGKKYGFCLNQGFPAAFNLASEYYLNTLFDDELKKSNKKTYQEIMFEGAELIYNKEHHPIYLRKEEKKHAKDFLRENNVGKSNLVGIHVGSSKRWPSKRWHLDNVFEFILKAREKGYNILLFTGPDEGEYIKPLFEKFKSLDIQINSNNPYNSDREFFALINECDYIISGDSFALHVAIALKKPSLGLFFCTSPHEVEDYGILKKLVSSKIYDFFPEKSDQYSEELTRSISAYRVLDALERLNIRNQIDQNLEANKTLLPLERKIQESASIIISALKNGKKILFCGNGGSAAQAQHFSAELVGRFEKERKGIPSISLTTDTSNITAIGNDYGYDKIFSRQIEALGQEGDVLICLSSSGNSENLIEATIQAKKLKLKTINLLGKDGGKMKGLADIDITVPLEKTARIQEGHLLLIHILAKLIEDSCS